MGHERPTSRQAVPASADLPEIPPAAPDALLRVSRERLIATCRVALAALSLLAVWIDPTEPTRFVGFAYWLLALYALAALALAQWAWTARVVPRAAPLTAHAVDLAVFFLLILVTAGPDSPFFIFLVFALVAATMRWQAAGTLWTGLAALAAFLVAGVLAERLEPVTAFEANRLIIRAIYLGVLGVLLAYVGTHERRLREKLAALGEPPPLVPSGVEEAVGGLLAHAARVLRAPRTALIWEEEEEPWTHLAIWSPGALERHRAGPGSLEPNTPAGLAEAPFFVTAPRAAGGGFRIVTREGDERAADDPLPPALRERLGSGSALSVPLRGESVAGRLLALGAQDMTADDIALGRILARQIAAQLDRLALFDRFHQERLADERSRLASDVHDGIIQSLAAAALRLETARQMLCQDPADAGRLIEESQDLLIAEQRELRDFVGGLAQDEPEATAPASPAAHQLELLRERIERHWDLRVALHGADAIGDRLEPAMARQLVSMVHEALVNASRHGRAASAVVDLAVQADELRLTVSDDGKGFPFRGRYDFATLTASRLGPLSLKRRIATLGGRLDIVSSEHGATLEVRLPLGAEGG